jgi:hypothetical protein
MYQIGHARKSVKAVTVSRSMYHLDWIGLLPTNDVSVPQLILKVSKSLKDEWDSEAFRHEKEFRLPRQISSGIRLSVSSDQDASTGNSKEPGRTSLGLLLPDAFIVSG